MSSTLAAAILAGTAVSWILARGIGRQLKDMRRIAQLTGGSPYAYYHKGGFDPVMSNREASLILGIREGSSTDKIREAHRRVMLANHPDRGGSPYLASKINEAKAVLSKGHSSSA